MPKAAMPAKAFTELETAPLLFVVVVVGAPADPEGELERKACV